MAMERRNLDRQFREGAVRIVRETSKPIAQVARELGVDEGTLGRWVNLDQRAREGDPTDRKMTRVSGQATATRRTRVSF